MPYSYPRNVPRVSKNWNAEQQKKCTAAANAVLRDGGSEREAVYACIHAAGKGKKQNMSTKREKSLATFLKDRNNGLWFVGVYSNNYIDRQHEIISEKAHQEYAEWLKATGVRPPIVMLHLPHFPEIVHYVTMMAMATGKMSVERYNALMMELYKSTAIAQTKTVVVKNGFSFVIGKVVESKRPFVEKLMKVQKTWGMSHGFIPLRFDDKLNVINMYRAFEFTLAPESLSANGLTAIGFKEDKMEDVLLKELSEEDRELIQQVFDEEDAETATAKAREVLRDLLASKMETPDEDEEDEATEDVAESDDTKEKAPDMDYKTLVDKLAVDFKLEELATVMKSIGERLSALETAQQTVTDKIEKIDQTEDERIVNQYFKGPDWSLGFGAQKLEKKTPDTDEESLIEKLKGDVPAQFVEGEVQVDTKNALQVGFWGPLLGNS